MNVNHLDVQLERLLVQEIVEKGIIDNPISRINQVRDAKVRLEAVVKDIIDVRELRKALLQKKEDSTLYNNVKEHPQIFG